MAGKQKQPSSVGNETVQLIEQLNLIGREASGLGAVFGEAVARRLGISPADLECLDLIFVRGRISAGEIAELTGLTTGAITGVIDRLEHAKYVRRERDPEDRRKVYVTALPAVRKLAATYYGGLEQQMNELIARYSRDELSLLIDYFTKTRDIISKEIKKIED